MFGKVVSQLNVELDEAVHGDCNAAGFKQYHLVYISSSSVPCEINSVFIDVPTHARMPG